MRLDRLGASFPTRLSFMRRLMRAMIDESSQVTRPVWDIDPNGHGRAVYSVGLGGHVYALIAYSQAIPDDMRTDRVIAEVWDTTYVLFDGVPTTADLDRLESQVPLQEAGRMQPSELVLCRANKSVRLFNHVVARLAEGQQPDREMIRAIGYLMRTTAVYGNGKFGIADREWIADRPVLDGPFAAEMLTVYLIRLFTHDLADHVAKSKGGARAVGLSADIRRHLGIGNATGLGMAPFLVNHPGLLHGWIQARETALARVCALPAATDPSRFHALLKRARAHVDDWSVDDAVQQARTDTLRLELAQVEFPDGPYPFAALMDSVAGASLECQELCAILLLEAHGDLVNPLAETMGTAPTRPFTAWQSAGEALEHLEQIYGWAMALPLDGDHANALAWYVSEDKLEPRLGSRSALTDPGQANPLDIAQQVQAFAETLRQTGSTTSLAEVLLSHPRHRHIARRVQELTDLPYAEIRDNLIDEGIRPIDLLRAKLAVFGASKFDPKSDRWTRVTLFQGAPLAEEIANGSAQDDWAFPVMP